MKIQRRDVHYSVRIPEDIKRVILEVGGKNPHGEPLYRILLAQDRVSLAHGTWTHFDENVPLDDRGGTGYQVIQKALREMREILEVAAVQMSHTDAVALSKKLGAEIDEMMKERLTAMPTKVELGAAYVPLYPFEGWILEKWQPADSFGSESDWSSFRFNGENALGTYPHQGEYELVAGPTPHILTVKQAQDAIRMDYKNIQTRPRSARERIRQMMETRELRIQAEQRKKRNFAQDFTSETNPIMRGTSLGAGRIRQEMAVKAGLKGHYGN